MRTSIPLLLTLVSLAGCTKAGGAPPPATVERVAVRTAPVGTATAADPVEATGTLAAREEAPLGFAVSGVLAHVLVRDGDAVRRGQLLASLDLREVDARLDRARSAVAKAERDLARVRALYADSVATRQQLDDATTAVEVARADADAAAYARQYATIVAPGTGVVLRRVAEPGQVVAPGAPVVVVGNRAAGTVLRVGLPDRDVVRVRTGNPATVRFDAQPGRAYAGTVVEIAGAASGQTGTYTVEIELEGASVLPSGLVGRVAIQPSAATDAHLVPTTAVVEADGDRASVFVPVRDSASADTALALASRRVVRLGGVRGDAVAVLDGLRGVSRVITDGAGFVTEGTPVRIVP